MLTKGKEANAMKAPEHRIFSIAAENAPVPGCTVSERVSRENGYYILHFSLAAGTSISAETYQYPKLWLVADGEMEAFTERGVTTLTAGGLYAAPRGVPVGVRAKENCVYTEITLKDDSNMNEIIKDGAVFALKNLLPTQADKIVNMEVINDEKLKFVVMSFAPGTALPEHAAPGEALIFALDGEGVIGYEGKEYAIRAGENFKFAKNGAHYVKADKPFKMALLLTLD